MTDKINAQDDIESTLGISLEAAFRVLPPLNAPNSLLVIRYWFHLSMGILRRILSREMRNVSSQNSSWIQIQRKTFVYIMSVGEEN